MPDDDGGAAKDDVKPLPRGMVVGTVDCESEIAESFVASPLCIFDFVPFTVGREGGGGRFGGGVTLTAHGDAEFERGRE